MNDDAKKLELEIKLMMADLEGKQEAIKHMQQGRKYMVFTATSLVFEIVLLVIIAWKI